MHDPKKWTAEVWAEVYGFMPWKGDGWASRKDCLYVAKFGSKHDLKDGFHRGNCQNQRERRIIEFIMPILSLEKPKRLNIIMANTMFKAISKVRPVNWGRLIQGYVENPFPTLAENLIFSPPTSSTSINTTDASTKRKRTR